MVAQVLGTEVLDCTGSCMRECNLVNVRLPLDLEKIEKPRSIPEWLKITGVRESGIYYQIIDYRGQFYWRISAMIYLEEADFRKGADILKALCVRILNGEHAGESAEFSKWETSSEKSDLDTPKTGSCPEF